MSSCLAKTVTEASFSRLMINVSWAAIMSFSFVPRPLPPLPFISMGSMGFKKGIRSLDSFPIWRDFVVQGSKQEVKRFASLYINEQQ